MEFTEIKEVKILHNLSKINKPNEFNRKLTTDLFFNNSDTKTENKTIETICNLDFINNGNNDEKPEDILKDIEQSFLTENKEIDNLTTENTDIEKNRKISKNSKRTQSVSLDQNIDQNNFLKLEKNQISNSFIEKISIGSSLSKRIMSDNLNIKTKKSMIKVYIFNEKNSINIEINPDDLVKNIKNIIMDYLSTNNEYNSLLLNNQAYELRLLDQSSKKILPNFKENALDQENQFSVYSTNQIILVENLFYKSQKEINLNLNGNINKISYQNKNFEKTSMENKIIENEKTINISIRGEKINFQVTIGIKQTIKDVFFQLKNINLKKYIIFNICNTKQIKEKNDMESEEIDLNFPISKLKSTNIELVKRVYADDPSPELISNNEKQDIYCFETEVDIDDPANVLINEVKAFKYEEFDVIKINERGTRQKRKLGIDQFKIYNKPHKLSWFFNLFLCSDGKENLAIQNPQRLIEDIIDIDMIKNNLNQFYLIVKDGTIKKNKIIVYETKNIQEKCYIFAKLKYIMYKKKNYINIFKKKDGKIKKKFTEKKLKFF